MKNNVANHPALHQFIAEHALPQQYLENVQQWFTPLINELVAVIGIHQEHSTAPLLVGINGSQGSGKSTLADLLATCLDAIGGYKVTVLSIDDFYLTRAERILLAESIHPLLQTRGVPGTHDVSLFNKVIDCLGNGPFPVAIPRFNKATDDRQPATAWDEVREKPDVIILEGWCLGSTPQPDRLLDVPVNTLEQEEDNDIHWRSFVNQQLKDIYPLLFERINYWIMLQAPSFDCVYQWRLEQEEKLRARTTPEDAGRIMSPEQIKRFIQHYQRITQHTLDTLPGNVDCLFKLDQERNIIKSTLGHSST